MSDAKSIVNRFVKEIINEKNYQAAEAFIAVDFVEHVPLPGQGPGRGGLLQIIAYFHQAFPDLQWVIHEQIAEGEKVASRFSWTGTHKGEFLGIAPTGKRVEVWGFVFDVVRNGWFTESRILMDVPALLQQLGK